MVGGDRPGLGPGIHGAGGGAEEGVKFRLVLQDARARLNNGKM